MKYCIQMFHINSKQELNLPKLHVYYLWLRNFHCNKFFLDTIHIIFIICKGILLLEAEVFGKNNLNDKRFTLFWVK